MSKRVLMVLTNAGKISEDGADGSAGELSIMFSQDVHYYWLNVNYIDTYLSQNILFLF